MDAQREQASYNQKQLYLASTAEVKYTIALYMMCDLILKQHIHDQEALGLRSDLSRVVFNLRYAKVIYR